MNNVSAGAVIFNDRREVLLVHHTYGVCNWEIPGGGGEPGESPMETAVREVLEETGLQVRPIAATGWYYDPSVDKMGGVFLCEVEDGAAVEPVADCEEISECRFWSPDALPTPISDWTILRIKDALNLVSLPLPTVIGPRVWIGLGEPSIK